MPACLPDDECWTQNWKRDRCNMYVWMNVYTDEKRNELKRPDISHQLRNIGILKNWLSSDTCSTRHFTPSYPHRTQTLALFRLSLHFPNSLPLNNFACYTNQYNYSHNSHYYRPYSPPFPRRRVFLLLLLLLLRRWRSWNHQGEMACSSHAARHVPPHIAQLHCAIALKTHAFYRRRSILVIMWQRDVGKME